MAGTRTPEEWRREIVKAYLYRKEFGDDEQWAYNREMYRNHFQPIPNLPAGVKQYDYNLIRGFASTIIPSSYFRNPYINITPTYKVDVGPTDSLIRMVRARIWEAIDNWMVKELKLKRTMRKAMLDHYLTGIGIIKSGYDGQFGFLPDNLNIDGNTGDNERKDGKGYVEYDNRVHPGMPWNLRVMPDYILLPFGCTEFESAEWVDHVILRKLADLKQDNRYVNVKDIKGTHTDLLVPNGPNKAYLQKLIGAENEEWVEIHEIHSANDKKVQCIIPSGNENKYIREPQEDPLQIEGLPFSPIVVMDDPEYVWNTADASVVKSQQLEMIEARTQTMLIRRVCLLKFLYKENAISDTELQKFLTGDIGVGIKVTAGTGPIGDAIQMLQPHIPGDLMAWVEGVRGDAREILGLGRNQLGDMDNSSRRSATEAGIVEGANQMRMDARRDAAADCLVDIIRKDNQMIAEFWSGNKVAEVVGVDGMKYWVTFQPKEIVGEFDIDVDIENAPFVTKQGKKMELGQLIGMFANNPSANVDSLLRGLLREYNWTDAMAVLPRAPEMQDKTMSLQQFQGQQSGLLNNSQQLLGRRKTAANMIKGKQQMENVVNA